MVSFFSPPVLRIQVHLASGEPDGCLRLAESSSDPAVPSAERQRTVAQWAMWPTPPGPMWAPVWPRDRWIDTTAVLCTSKGYHRYTSVVMNAVPLPSSTIKSYIWLWLCTPKSVPTKTREKEMCWQEYFWLGQTCSPFLSLLLCQCIIFVLFYSSHERQN